MYYGCTSPLHSLILWNLFPIAFTKIVLSRSVTFYTLNPVAFHKYLLLMILPLFFKLNLCAPLPPVLLLWSEKAVKINTCLRLTIHVTFFQWMKTNELRIPFLIDLKQPQSYDLALRSWIRFAKCCCNKEIKRGQCDRRT